MTTFQRLETLSDARRFNSAVFDKVRPHLGRNVLEVGMGIGTFTERLLDEGRSVVGIDVVAEFVDTAAARLKGRRGFEAHVADIGGRLPTSLTRRRFDTILCMNVLEHVEDDEGALRLFYDLLEQDGRLVLVVPQYRWLFNGLDANDGHFRRYDRSSLREALGQAGLSTEFLACFNLLGIAGWFLNGALLRRRELPKKQMRVFDLLAPYLFKAESWIGPPAGLSLLAVGRKRASP